MSEINELDLMDGIELIAKAREKREEEKAFQLYTARFTYMDQESYIPFEEFYKPQQEVAENKSTEEILQEVRETLNTFKGKWVA